MQFKQFLLNEDLDADAGSSWFYGNQLFPSDAYDMAQAYSVPPEVQFMKNRWKLEKKLGRKFINIDYPKEERYKFTSIYSKTMPEAGGSEGWKHKPDSGPNLEIDHDANYELHGHRTRADISKILWKPNPMINNEKELNKLFGKFEPNPYNLPDDFDKPWKHKKD